MFRRMRSEIFLCMRSRNTRLRANPTLLLMLKLLTRVTTSTIKESAAQVKNPGQWSLWTRNTDTLLAKRSISQLGASPLRLITMAQPLDPIPACWGRDLTKHRVQTKEVWFKTFSSNLAKLQNLKLDLDHSLIIQTLLLENKIRLSAT